MPLRFYNNEVVAHRFSKFTNTCFEVRNQLRSIEYETLYPSCIQSL